MRDINQELPLNKEVKEAIASTFEKTMKKATPEQNAEVREYLLSNPLPKADISNYLVMKIIDGELYKPKYRFIFSQIFPKLKLRLGNVEKKYTELKGGFDTRDVNGDNIMEDFNGKLIEEYAEVYKIDKVYHGKAKVPEMLLSNAWVAANQMMEFVMLQVENLAYGLDRLWENVAADKLVKQGTIKEIGTGDAIEVSKTIDKIMLDWRTTSDEQYGVVQEGTKSIVINPATDPNNPVQIKPDLYFDNPADFVVVVDNSIVNDVKFQNEAQWYNYSATEISGLRIVPLDFANYKGFKEVKKYDDSTGLPAVEIPKGTKAILFHKDAIELLEQYQYSRAVQGASAFAVQHNFVKYDSYRNKTLPIVFITQNESKKKQK